MNIIQYQNAMTPDESTQHYFDIVVDWGEKRLRWGMQRMSKTIPIYFVTEDKLNQQRHSIAFQKREELSEIFRHNREGYCDFEKFCDENIDPLGLYFSQGIIQNAGPEIWVSYEKICRCCPGNTKYATLVILTHELGHALLDPATSGRQPLAKWLEEPMANFISLSYLDCAGPSRTSGSARIEFARDFVSKQPTNYRQGLDIFDAFKECPIQAKAAFSPVLR